MAASDMSWYPAYVRSGQEIRTRNVLSSWGVEHFIPTKNRPNYRGKMVEHPIVPSLVFIYSTREGVLTFKMESGIRIGFLTERNASGKQLTVPDQQMEDFRRVLSQQEPFIACGEEILELGDEVLVTQGPLKGVEGRVTRLKGRCHVAVSIVGLLTACAEVPRVWLRKMRENRNSTIHHLTT